MADEIEKVLDEKVVDVKSDYCEPLQKPKPKKNLTEKQKEIGRANLAKGRETLAIKRKQQKEEQQKTADEMIVKKAEKLVKTKANQDKKLKSVIGEISEEDVEIEERIMKKPKRKKIIYREESDSEEEVIIKSRPKKHIPVPKEPVEPRQEPKEPRQAFRINFC